MAKEQIEGPSGPQQFKPGDATSLPTKKYHNSDLAKHPGKSNSVQGPCDGKECYTK